ncbi:MAG: lamin tail domain-containing protein [Anaerolineae bacterium]
MVRSKPVAIWVVFLLAVFGVNLHVRESNASQAASDLMITEIMYNPRSSEPAWEWVEIYNSGSSSVNLSGFVLDDINPTAHSGPNIASGSIGAGKSAVLYNADSVSAADFRAAWGDVDLIPVTGWSKMPINNGTESIALWESFADYEGDHETHANSVEKVAYHSFISGWPTTQNGKSIFLKNLGSDNSVGSNWGLSSIGESTPLFVGYQSEPAGGNSGLDIGSPGSPPPPPTPVPTETPLPLPTETLVPPPTETLVPPPTETLIPLPTETLAPPPTETLVPPPTETLVPPPTETLAPPPTETLVPPPTETLVPPPTETLVPPPTETLVLPPTETLVPPPTETLAPPPTETLVPPPTETLVPPPTETLVPPPTETLVPPPTETLVPPPTETLVPPPTETLVPPPTETLVPPPTETLVPPPTETLIPLPTETLVPSPTETLVPPPTETLVPPPTETLVPPPTETLAPLPTETLVPPPAETPLPPAGTPLPTQTSIPIETPSPSQTPTSFGPRLKILSTSISQPESNSGTIDFVFKVLLDKAVPEGFDIGYETNGLTATVGEDFAEARGVLSFTGLAGETKIITVKVYGDATAEQDETFELILTLPADAGLDMPSSTLTGIGRILNDDRFKVHIPQLFQRFEFPKPEKHLPDLVVDSIGVVNGEAVVVLQNIGAGPVESAFWVDLFVNPIVDPVELNDTLEQMGETGWVWGVTDAALPMSAGARLTLTLDSAYFSDVYSTFSGEFVDRDRFVVHVDSASTIADYGGVLESHEQQGESYNNIASIVIEDNALRGLLISFDELRLSSPY